MPTRAGALHELLYHLAEHVRRHEHAHEALATAVTASRHRTLPLGCDPIDAESLDALRPFAAQLEPHADIVTATAHVGVLTPADVQHRSGVHAR
ncbi:hypothetical protein [Streptomyces nojiriensis]|uniref:hypothetical protein n=1 Tax=Streptomyces nojiriensis TaxID=66374 RepID=UPI003665AE3B